MSNGTSPKWLQKLERRLPWLAVSNIASFVVGLQFIGFVLVYSDPSWTWRLALIPELVLQGEIWRLFTFLPFPIAYVGDLESTLFLAAAALNPEYQILLFLVLPVKIAWLAWLTGAFVLLRFFSEIGRAHLLT